MVPGDYAFAGFVVMLAKTPKLFLAFAFIFACTAVFHALGVVLTLDSSPHWRHALFACINAACVYGVLSRPRWFVYAFAVLLLQQLFSHGADLVAANRAGHLDITSLLDLIGLPVVFAFLVRDLRRSTKAIPPD